MGLGINLLLNLKNNFNLIRKFRSSLFFRLSTLIAFFSLTLVFLLVWGFWFSFQRQDSMLDAHEAYFYSNMVNNWGTPPDTIKVKEDIDDLKIQCSIYKIENDYSREGATHINSPKYWSSSSNFPDDFFYTYQGPEDFKKYNINIPNYVYFGLINDIPATAIEKDGFVFYTSYYEQNTSMPTDIPNYLVALLLTIIFIISLNFFIRRYLHPVQLVKDRLLRLEEGDLESTIPILGEDELARLSIGINKIIYEINNLIDEKQALLLDVSHELRSPLARMQLLLEMIPEHTNKKKLINEVLLLEGMISNLLLSDKLSIPYKNLNLSNINIHKLVDNILDMFPSEKNKIKVNNHISEIIIIADELKLQLAIRNLIDNALKYNDSDKNIIFDINKKNNFIYFIVTDFGVGINQKDIKSITEPFVRLDSIENKINGFGIGLTITKKVIEAHRGELIIKSNINKGSSFSIKIPFKGNN